MTTGANGLGGARLFTFGRLAVEAAEGLSDGGPRPRRLALLAILAARGGRGQTRERILAILWQDSSETRGRHALSQTLYALRQDLNREVVQARPGDVLSLDPTVISSDIEDFRRAVAARDWSQAAALYAGPFAAGFTLSEAPGFEEWLDEERRRLAREGHKALLAAARQAEAEGDLSRALPHWHRLTSSDALNTPFAVGYARTLFALGDRDGALDHARIHSELIRRELGAEPDPDLAGLIKALGSPSPATPSPDSNATVAPTGHADSRRRSTVSLAAVVLIAVILGGVTWRLMAGRSILSRHVLTRGHELVGPTSSMGDVTTRSPVAYRLYEEGRRAFIQTDWPTAGRLFRAALAEDSTFALAAIYAWRVAGESGGKDSLEPTILRLMDRAPDRERLLARTLLGTQHSDPPALAMADSLEQRFPSDPDALIASATARLHRHGFTPEVVAQLERVFTLDSMTGVAALRGARVAEALHKQFDAYMLADSGLAAERILRRWMPLQPENATPLYFLARLFERQGRLPEADAAYARNDELAVVKNNLVYTGIWKGISRGDPELLLQSCRFGLSGAHDVGQFTEYRWECLLAYRHMGRLREAMALTRPRRLAPAPGSSGSVSVGEEGLNRIILDWMMGRPDAAARGFLEVAKRERSGSLFPGENARRESWWLTLAATAFIAARDTAEAAALTDSIQAVGARSMYGRDPLLHHFVRGLVLSAKGRHEDAMSEFLSANYSWPLGYTRVNYEYARCALALGRPP
jgi:DNA-binding SARP family transcriptional activator